MEAPSGEHQCEGRNAYPSKNLDHSISIFPSLNLIQPSICGQRLHVAVIALIFWLKNGKSLGQSPPNGELNKIGRCIFFIGKMWLVTLAV